MTNPNECSIVWIDAWICRAQLKQIPVVHTKSSEFLCADWHSLPWRAMLWINAKQAKTLPLFWSMQRHGLPLTIRGGGAFMHPCAGSAKRGEKGKTMPMRTIGEAETDKVQNGGETGGVSTAESLNGANRFRPLRERQPVIVRCLWRRRRDAAQRFALLGRRLHAFAKPAHSRLYDMRLELPVRGAVRKGDRVQLMGNFEGLYQVLTLTKIQGAERALLIRCPCKRKDISESKQAIQC